MTKSKRSVSDQRMNYFKLCLQLFVYLRAILRESEAKLEMKNFNPSSIFVCR